MKKILIFFTLFLCAFSNLCHAVVAGHLVNTEHVFSESTQQISFTYRIMDDGGYDARYYWATQFYLLVQT